MQCRQCDAPLEADAKFCTNCGAKVLDNTVEDQAQTSEPVGEKGTMHAETEAQAQEKANDYVEQGKQVTKQYWNFIPGALGHPFQTSKRVSDGDKINAIITLALFSILLPLFAYTTIRKLSDGYFQPPFFDMVIKPFFVLVIFFVVLIAVKFGVAKLMKANVTFWDVLTIFGTLMILPTVVAFGSLILSFVSSYTFSTILFFFSISFTSIASMASVFSLKARAPEKAGLDAVYGVIITYIAMAIIVFIIGDSVVGNLISEIERNLYYAPF